MSWILPLLACFTCARLALMVRRVGARSGSGWRSAAGEVVDALLLASAAVFLVVRPFALQAFYVPSGSMQPTLTPDDRILVDKLTYAVARPHRHDVVVFRAPREAVVGAGLGADDEDFVKRVVALPGDTVEVRTGSLFLNGERQQEPYTYEPPSYDFGPVTVPPGRLFVMGDNRNNSFDSHRWGTLDERLVIGRAVLIFWPPPRIGAIR